MAEKQRILIVDDDYNIAELISLYLTKECFETKIVGDGEEALRVFPEFQPNLILLDLMLPGIDGYQVCRELRSTSQVPIIMLSAKGEIFDKVLGLELGADDYMIKPFLFPTAEIPAVATILSFTTDTRSSCRRRNWNCSISSRPHRIRYSQESSFSTISGDMNTSATRGRWTSISSGSVRKSRATTSGR